MNKLVEKHVFKKYKCSSPFDICSAFASIENEISKHGELNPYSPDVPYEGQMSCLRAIFGALFIRDLNKL